MRVTVNTVNTVFTVLLVATGLSFGATSPSAATPATAVTAASTAATADESCTVEAATIEWGFKESFRSYISGSIANGKWTVSDGASYQTPTFAFADGDGEYDPSKSTGLIGFPGAITFTGHGGILNTTVANPQLKFVNTATAFLVLDVTGTTQDGAPIDSAGVEFAILDLSGASALRNGVLTITEAPAVLTAAGAEAFGTYEEGEEFDALNASIPIADDCA
ncbi:MAG: HtaA domain-containing protein, partial [Salinibacterium sp.]|nr:HtaA domain-containing protein [Salinibacterium sp.]